MIYGSNSYVFMLRMFTPGAYKTSSFYPTIYIYLRNSFYSTFENNKKTCYAIYQKKILLFLYVNVTTTALKDNAKPVKGSLALLCKTVIDAPFLIKIKLLDLFLILHDLSAFIISTNLCYIYLSYYN